MTRISRWPLVVVCLGLGALGATVATDRLHGQPALPAPPPIAAAPQPAFMPGATSYREIVKKVLPAVVSIEAKLSAEQRRARQMPQLPPGVPGDFRQFLPIPQPSGPIDLGFGSGVLIDSSGVVLTNYHVVEGADTLEITLEDGRTFTSKDIRRDAKTDLAVVRLKSDKPLPFLELGDSDAAQVGDWVLAVGAPFGLTGSVTHGIISAKSRHNLRMNQYEDFLQTDAAINPGNSGGPLVSLDGKILGINSAIKTKSGGFQGIGLAVSSNLARGVARQLMENGVVHRGYLGVAVRELDTDLAARLGVAKGQGVLISKVFASSPAEQAGLQVGDVLTKVGGMTVKDVDTLPRAILKLPLNKPIDVTYNRDGKPHTRTVTLEEQPKDYGNRAPVQPGPPIAPNGPNEIIEVQRAGASVTDLTPALAARLGYPRGSRGAVVANVDRNSPAAGIGLMRGMVVVKVDKTSIETAQQFADAVADASVERGALIQVLRPSGEADFAVLKVK